MKNREIKFRIYDKINKEFVNNYFIRNGQIFPLALDTNGLLVTSFYKEPHRISDLGHGIETISNQSDFVIQQFTGSKDSKDKEIYDGDIIKFYKKIDIFTYDYSFKMNYVKNPEKKDKWDYLETRELTRIVQVFFSTQPLGDFNEVSGWFAKDYRSNSLVDLISEHQVAPGDYIDYVKTKEANYEIIGNIFETPELLDKKNE